MSSQSTQILASVRTAGRSPNSPPIWKINTASRWSNREREHYVYFDAAARCPRENRRRMTARLSLAIAMRGNISFYNTTNENDDVSVGDAMREGDVRGTMNDLRSLLAATTVAR